METAELKILSREKSYRRGYSGSFWLSVLFGMAIISLLSAIFLIPEESSQRLETYIDGLFTSIAWFALILLYKSYMKARLDHVGTLKKYRYMSNETNSNAQNDS